MIRFAVRFLGSALLTFCLVAHGEPKAITEKKEEKRPAVLACFARVSSYCAAAKKILTGPNCKPSVDLIEMTGSPTPADIKKKLGDKKLPDGTPVFVIGHGPARKGLTHTLETSGEKDAETADVLDAFSAYGKPVYWLMSCKGGQACDDDKKGYCIGSVCQGNQDATLQGSEAGLDKATNAILQLYCDEKEFNDADKNKNGVLDKSELTTYFCEKADGGRPYTKFYPKKKDYETNKKKIQEMATLMLQKLVAERNGDSLDAADEKKLKELMDENDGERIELEKKYEAARLAYNATVNPYNRANRRLKDAKADSDEEKEAKVELETAKKHFDDALEAHNKAVRALNKAKTKFAIQKSSKSFLTDIEFYVDKLKGKVTPKSIKWIERPEQASFEDTRSGDKLDQLLVMEFPAPEKKACIWVDGRTVSQFNPHLDKFSLRFRPTTPTEGGEKKDGGKADSHKEKEEEKK